MAQRLSASEIDALAEQLVPGPPGSLSPSRAGTSRVRDERGKSHWHGWGQRKAYDAGTAPVSVIGGTYGCDDKRITTEGWSPIKKTATGDDCLRFGTSTNSLYEVIGAVILPSHDGVAPSKGVSANSSRCEYLIEDALFLGQRDESHENDASLRGVIRRALMDSVWMGTSMRNPNNDRKMKHNGHTDFENVLMRFAAQPDPRSNRSGAPKGYGGGGLIIKAGSRTGTADYTNFLAVWNTRHNARKEGQGFRRGKAKDAFALYAPGWKPQPFFRDLPGGWTDLGKYENGEQVWFACVKRWGQLYDTDPSQGRFGYAGVASAKVPMVREPWSYDWSYDGGADTGNPTNGDPTNGDLPPPDESPYPVKMSGKNQRARVLVPIETEAGTEEAMVTMTVEDPDWPTEGELWHGDVLVATLFGGGVTGAGHDKQTVDLSFPLPAEVLEAVQDEDEVEMELRWLETAGFTVHDMVVEGKEPDEPNEPEEPKPDIAAIRKALVALQEQRGETQTVLHQVFEKEDAAVDRAFGALPEEEDD